MDIGIVRTPIVGETGKSAYELAVATGFVGTLEEWLASLKGVKGDQGLQGPPGPQGLKGDPGKTSYDLAVEEGFGGTQENWYNQFRIESIAQDIVNLREPFISIWDTTKTSTGSSSNNKVKLPLISTGTYDFWIDWGDGVTQNIKTWNQAQVTHTYTRPASYLITIKGKLEGWNFNNTGDRLKLLDVKTWGNLKIIGTGGYFYGCSNMKVTASDTFNTAGCTNFNNFFNGCTSLTSFDGLNYINTTSVISMENMFRSSSFNGDISNFDFRNVVSLADFFTNNSSFTSSNYSKLLSSLADQTLQNDVTMDVTLTKYLTTAQSSRASIISNYNWTITDAGLQT
jgi:hypothetical protein